MLGLLIGLTSVAAGAAACGDMIDSKADLEGFVTAIEPGGDQDVLGKILVESHADKLVHRCAVTLTKDTVMSTRDEGGGLPVTFDQIQLRDRVQVWFAGSAQDSSCPSGAKVRKLVIGKR